ncbi:hypothetical protein JB92DRAFT_3122587 [Gautieria morchelliformis]|nr:hypothetical protein JB92DRAFT_3122587 [Gautieria morchelliformis]
MLPTVDDFVPQAPLFVAGVVDKMYYRTGSHMDGDDWVRLGTAPGGHPGGLHYPVPGAPYSVLNDRFYDLTGFTLPSSETFRSIASMSNATPVAHVRPRLQADHKYCKRDLDLSPSMYNPLSCFPFMPVDGVISGGNDTVSWTRMVEVCDWELYAQSPSTCVMQLSVLFTPPR